MAVTYQVKTAETTFGSGRRYVPGNPFDTYSMRRGYMKFDLSGRGLTLPAIQSVSVKLYAAAQYGVYSTQRLRSGDGLDNWGAILEANEADWISTDTYVEDEQYVNALGWWEFAVNKSHLNLAGWTYFRIADVNEGDQEYGQVNWASQNAAANRPILRIVYN